MTKIYDFKSIAVNGVMVNYFYTRERNDRYGNPRYRVYTINLETRAVTENIVQSYNIEEWIRHYIKESFR